MKKTTKRTTALFAFALAIARLAFLATTSAILATAPAHASDFKTIHSFGFAEQIGQSPRAPLIRGSDGALYGTAFGGETDAGAIFRINQDGGNYRTLHRFGSVTNDGVLPNAGLVEASDGALYGTTSSGGIEYFGTIFKINKDGSGYNVLHRFAKYADGQTPRAELVEGNDGALYGTTSRGGSPFIGGIVFKINKDGTAYTNLHAFSPLGSDGTWPEAALLKASDGGFYGTTERGGANGRGTLFKLNQDGTGFSVVHDFGAVQQDGAASSGPLMEASDGWLYGTTALGGATNSGTVFKLQKNGSNYTVLHSFNLYGVGGSYPACALVEGADGALYGTVPNGEGTVFKLNKDGSGFESLHTFAFANADGTGPSGLLIGSDGSLYGTTVSGGSNMLGTIFKLNQDGGAYTILYHFFIAGGDGLNPQTATLLDANDGFLYGTTPNGGSGSCNLGCGTIFKTSKNGAAYSLLHAFSSTGQEGYSPKGGLIQGVDGSLYGTTSQGGSGNAGTVFKLDPNGTALSILHNFSTSNSDGQYPAGELLQTSDGALYGATSSGGSNYYGTVFRLGANGSDYTLLHQFRFSGGDGQSPVGGLIEGRDGALYGITGSGGSNGDYGTVFKLKKDGTSYSILHHFNYNGWDGFRPFAALIEGNDGSLYGTTPQGGTNNFGTVFKLNEDGSDYTILHSFNSSGDGDTAVGALVRGVDGMIYGTAAYGGTQNGSFPGCGTVFRLNPDGTGFSTVYTFSGSEGDGCNPRGALLRGSDQRLYGTTSEGGELGLGTLFSLCLSQTHIVCPSNLNLLADPGQCSKSNVTFSVIATDGCGSDVTLPSFPPSGSTFPIGTTIVSCTVTDATGGISLICSFPVTVVDNQAPVIAAESITPAILWPPDHRMVDVFVGYDTSDNCTVQATHLSVTSNESIGGIGGSETSPDWEVVDNHHVKLRAERSGSGNGRLYTITITVTDNSGNSSTKTLTVQAPKNNSLHH